MIGDFVIKAKNWLRHQKPESDELQQNSGSDDQEHGSVSMESVMDTVTRVLASVAVLGAVFGLLVTAYTGIGTNVKTVQTSGATAVSKVTNQIDNTNFTTP
ncbi:MAG: hypothetical protein WCE94_08880 [Candidatus Methanoperedens sp.]